MCRYGLNRLMARFCCALSGAEDDDSNYYLMRLDPANFVSNAKQLADYSQSHDFGTGACVITFLCESRKYVIEHEKAEGRGSDCEEARELLATTPRDVTVIGFYLNGEFSTGHRRSIGYHNYSENASVFHASTQGSFHLPYTFARPAM